MTTLTITDENEAGPNDAMEALERVEGDRA